MTTKIFRFTPAQYGTDYTTIKRIYIYGEVYQMGDQVAIEYDFDYQVLGLFVSIATTEVVPPTAPEKKVSRWDLPLALVLIPLLIWVLIWLFS